MNRVRLSAWLLTGTAIIIWWVVPRVAGSEAIYYTSLLGVVIAVLACRQWGVLKGRSKAFALLGFLGPVGLLFAALFFRTREGSSLESSLQSC